MGLGGIGLGMGGWVGWEFILGGLLTVAVNFGRIIIKEVWRVGGGLL
jgi:hypothetical protein